MQFAWRRRPDRRCSRGARERRLTGRRQRCASPDYSDLSRGATISVGGIMQNRLMVCLMALALGTVALAREKPAQEKPAQAADAYVGTWAGTWTSEDGGSGTVELTLEKGADGKPSGSIKSSGGDADHAAPFKSL